MSVSKINSVCMEEESAVCNDTSDLTASVPQEFSLELFNKYKCVVKSEIELQILYEAVQSHMNENMDSFTHFDFCLIASDVDYVKAKEIKDFLCNNFRLKGCMVEDNFSLGMDILQNYERMMEQSTKILFYITQNFNENDFYQRIQNGAIFQTFMTKARTAREKCVPVLTESFSKVKIPLALSGIAGIQYNPASSFTTSILKKTFTPQLRNLRIQNQQKTLEYHFKELMDRKVCEYLAEQKRLEDEPEGKISLTSTSTQSNSSFQSDVLQEINLSQQIDESETTLQDVSKSNTGLMNLESLSEKLPPSDVNLPSRISNELTTILTKLPTPTSPTHCTVTESSNVTIGNTTVIHIHLNSKENNETDSESSSDSD